MNPVSACLGIFSSMLVKEISQGIKILMAEKTECFVQAYNEVRLYLFQNLRHLFYELYGCRLVDTCRIISKLDCQIV